MMLEVFTRNEIKYSSVNDTQSDILDTNVYSTFLQKISALFQIKHNYISLKLSLDDIITKARNLELYSDKGWA
jgi:hypothetical protein